MGPPLQREEGSDYYWSLREVTVGRSESKSELLYDSRFTANQFVLATSPLRLTTSNFIFPTEHLQSLCNILFDKRMGVLFTIAAGYRQRSHS
jgi:hypothetical protein